jgi:hypothetical protein
VVPIVDAWNRTARACRLRELNPAEIDTPTSSALFALLRAGMPVGEIVHAIEQVPKYPWLLRPGPGGTAEEPRPVTLHWLVSDREHLMQVARGRFEQAT